MNFSVSHLEGDARVSKTVFVAANAVTFEKATPLGHREDENCESEEWMAGTWSDAQTQLDGIVAHYARMRGLDPTVVTALLRTEGISTIDAAPLSRDAKISELQEGRRQLGLRPIIAASEPSADQLLIPTHNHSQELELLGIPPAVSDVRVLDCKNICAQTPPSADCYKLSISSTTTAAVKQALYLRDSSSPPNWTDVFRPLIGQTTATCKRLDVKDRDDELSNVGGQCTYPFGKPPGDKVKALGALHVPSRVTGRLVAAGGRFVAFKAISAMESPTILFGTQQLSVYGGYIVQVTADDKRTYYQTSAPACIEVEDKQ